ncbi:MAG: amidohydrolase family protein [Proteobacteria bacterium]|nr:amidohydrolase family protein [Pseudomonadota bacterium]
MPDPTGGSGRTPRMMLARFALLFVVLITAACAMGAAVVPEEVVPHFGRLIVRGALLAGAGSPVDVEVLDGWIVAVGPSIDPKGAEVVDATGQWIAPAFIDSHVHMEYYPMVSEMAGGGGAAVVDHAAPVVFFERDWAPLQVLGSGPMVTAVGGYPTQGWGAGGYGREVVGGNEAAEAVRELRDLGAGLIKLPVTTGSQLQDDAMEAAVAQAHAVGLKVSTHAMGNDHAQRAADVGCDLLAHTPTSALNDEAIEAWAGRAVISSLRAFGGGAAAVANLEALRGRGATVLYGTDFGNTRTPGIDRLELTYLMEAGFSGAAILEAGTAAPVAFWGFDDLGAIEPGKRASFLLLDRDPLQDPLVLSEPAAVFIDGNRR